MNKNYFIFGFIFIFMISLVSGSLIDDNINYWNFDGDATDSIGTNDLTVNGVTNGLAYGKINEGYLFDDSSSDHLTKNGNTDLSNTFTINMWVKRDDTTNTEYLYWIGEDGNTGNTYVYSYTDNTGKIYWDIRPSASTDRDSVTTTNAVISNTNYNMISYVREGSGTSNMKIYINGVSVPLNTNTNNAPTISFSNKDIFLGISATNTFSFSGYMDEPSIWDRALSSDEITEIYNSGDGLQYPYGSLKYYFDIQINNTYTEESILNFSALINGDIYSTTNGTINTNINMSQNLTYDVLIFNATNYFNKTINNWNTNTSLITSVYPYTYINVKNKFTNDSVSNFTINSTEFGEVSTSDGYIYYPLFNGTFNVDFYNISDDTRNYANTNTNLTANDYLQNYTLYADYVNSIDIYVYDQTSSELITDDVYLTLTGLSNTTNYNITGGNLYLSNLTAGTYQLDFQNDEYTKKTYFITVTDYSTQTLNAYLTTSTEEVIFSILDSSSGATIEGATISMSAQIGGIWTIIETRESDVAGGVKFNYEDDETYRFSITKSNYQTKNFELDPILFSSYNINLIPSTTANNTMSFSGVSLNYLIEPYLASNNITYLSKNFIDNQTNSFIFIINSPTGTLENYGLTLTYKDKSNTTSDTNTYGNTFNLTLPIYDATFMDFVTLDYYYTNTNGITYNYTQKFSIDINTTTGTFNSLRTNKFGLGILERVLIVIIIAGIFAGLIGLFNGALAGGIIAMFIFGFFINTGFLEIWFVILPIIMIFMWIVWRQG